MPVKGHRATHCKRGHPLTPENRLSVGKSQRGGGGCRQCLLDQLRAKRASAITGPSLVLVRGQRWKAQAEAGAKPCSRCGQTKPFSEFNRHSKTKDGLRPDCRECQKKRDRELATPERRAAMAARIRDAAHGLVPGEYDLMLNAQAGGCAICGNGCKSGRSLAVDHDHATGEIRGLLCANCNRSIGMMADSPERLRAAARYLEDHAQKTLP